MKKIFSLFAVAAFAVSVAAQPSALPTAPTHPANQVKAVYSTTYNADCGYGEWGSGTQYSQDTYGKKYVTTNLGYFGLVDFELNCSKMEVLHLDVWSAGSFSMGIVPIHGAAEVRVTKDVVGGQWNAIEIPLSAFEGVTNWTNVYQIKIDNVGNQTFWLNNVYFYTTQVPEEDTEAPTALTANLAYASYFSATINVSASDNSGVVKYEVMNGEEVVATQTGVSGTPTTVTVAGLLPNTEYNFSVVAKDEAGNATEAVSVAAKTLEAPAPAPAPTIAAANVKSIYSDAYTPAWTSLNSFNEGWWNAPKMAEGNLVEGDKVLYYYGFTDGMIGWQFGAFDATGFTTFTMDIYPLADGKITLGPLNEGGGDYAVAGIDVKANQWNTITIDLTSKDLTKIFQVKMIDYYALGSFFIDNVYLYSATESAVDNITIENKATKLIENGQLYIIRNGVKYDATGSVVR